jgi:hypothetical protein
MKVTTSLSQIQAQGISEFIVIYQVFEIASDSSRPYSFPTASINEDYHLGQMLLCR